MKRSGQNMPVTATVTCAKRRSTMRLTRYLALLAVIVGLGCWSGCSSMPTSYNNGGSYSGGSANSHAGHNH